MGAVQTSYAENQRKAVVGMIANQENWNGISRLVGDADGIGFGLPVFQSEEEGFVTAAIGALEAASAAKAGGNTGTGTLTLDATTPVLPGAKPGVYTVRAIAAASNSGTFRVEDPDGNVIGDVAVGATFSDDVKFVIADGGTDFIVGDGFDITVTAQEGRGRFVGMTIRDVTLEPTAADVLPHRHTASILTLGVIWALAGAAVSQGDPVYLTSDGDLTNEAAGNEPLPRATFDSDAADGALVKVRLQ